MKRYQRVLMAVVWPAFLMAGVLEMLVFSVVEPASLQGFDGDRLGWSSTTVYSLAFLVFWVVIAAAGVISHLLGESSAEVNSRSFR